uniref:Leiomodin-2 n=1 Tax=Oryzias latipes TaxID=8090 RepID=A0A3P9JK09_ORYLA
MSYFGYRRELSKYEEVDEDELLASLSPEELAELEKELVDIDPDANVPIGLRQRDQTDKTPTGTFSREALMKYWENETRRLLEDEIEGGSPKLDEGQEREFVTQGSSEEEDDKDKNEKEQKKSIESNEDEEESCDEEEDEDIEEEEEPVTEDDEEEEEEEEQVKSEPMKHSELGRALVIKPSPVKPAVVKSASPTPPGDPNTSRNPTVVDDVLQRALNNDAELTEINLNNIDDISQETLIRFTEALRSNTNVRVFSLANTRADDPVALAVAKMLKENSSITSLNIESNYVTGKGVMALVQALPANNTLTELRFHNQRHMCGGQVEMEMVKILRENCTLIKLGYQFNLPGPRMSMTGILTRNQDRQRQKRMQEQRQQQQDQQRIQNGAVNPRTSALRETPSSSPHGSPRGSPWSSPKLPQSNQVSKQTPPAPPPPPPPPPPLPPPAPKQEVKKKKPTRMIAEVIRAHEAGSTKATKPKGKKGKKGREKEETSSILKELKNALRPVSADRKEGESSRPSTPMRSAHDQLMESIRTSSIRSLRRVEIPHHLK